MRSLTLFRHVVLATGREVRPFGNTLGRLWDMDDSHGLYALVGRRFFVAYWARP